MTKGEAYAKSVNDMVSFGEANGWENWKGKEPEDNREHLSLQVIHLLKEANSSQNIEEFRKLFPPAHGPFTSILEKEGQNIENLCHISETRVVFVVGASWEKRQAWILDNRDAKKLSSEIKSIGKSPANDVFAIAGADSIITYAGWEGEKIKEFKFPELEQLPINSLIPFNDGMTVLLISSEGIYHITPSVMKMIHPVNDPENKDFSPSIDMEHAAISYSNHMIAVGDQNSEHRILNQHGDQIALIGQQSSYPHYAIFSQDDNQVLVNSCHFYNGISIAVPTSNIHGLNIEPYSEDDRYIRIDEDCRVYAAVAANQYYILGDAVGYIKAFDMAGNKLWRYFLGSTITGMSISDNGEVLWVATYAGIIHKLRLNTGYKHSHVIGNANHQEEFRVLFWKSQPAPLIW